MNVLKNLLRDHKLIHGVFNKMGSREVAEMYANGELIMDEKPTPEPIPEPTLFLEGDLVRIKQLSEITIHVNHGSKMPLPNKTEMMHSDLQSMGLADFDLSQIESYIHKGYQDRNSGEKGDALYEHLKENGELARHLGLDELWAIQKAIQAQGTLGIKLFRTFCAPGDSTLCGWKSVVGNQNGDHHKSNHHNKNSHHNDMSVPYLLVNSIKLRVGWISLSETFYSSNPGLRFRKEAM